MIIGLTGGYCCGKNAAAAFLEARGWISIDVDRLGHEALAACADAVGKRFGPSVLDARGGIDRKALGALVFSDPEALAAHEAIVHPAMFSLLEANIAGAESQAAVEGREARVCVNAAILYKMPVATRCDAIIEVQAPLFARLARAKARDGLGTIAALKRILSQRPLWRLRPKTAPGIRFVENGGGMADFGAAMEAALESILGA